VHVPSRTIFSFGPPRRSACQEADYVYARMAYRHLFDPYSLRSFRGLRQRPVEQEHLTRVLSAMRRGARAAARGPCSFLHQLPWLRVPASGVVIFHR
jgi:hypothetical protein